MYNTEKNIIEFSGYISGKAEVHFRKKSRRFGQLMVTLALSIFFPPVLYYTIMLREKLIIVVYILLYVIYFLLTFLPPRKKDRTGLLPKKIVIEDEYLTCIADSYVESKSISDVKVVYDYGEFYDIVFPAGKYSEKFVCQKDLLIRGTLKEFENLFLGKLVKK